MVGQTVGSEISDIPGSDDTNSAHFWVERQFLQKTKTYGGLLKCLSHSHYRLDKYSKCDWDNNLANGIYFIEDVQKKAK